MNNIVSILFYFIVGFVCFGISKKINRRPTRVFWLIVIILTLIAGLRNSSVGVDAYFYADIVGLQKSHFVFRISNVKEIGYLTLSYISAQIADGYTLIFLMAAFLTNFLIIRRVYEEREKIDFSWAVFIYYFSYFFMTFNTLRQWIAIAIIFYFSKFIGKGVKGYISYGLAVALSVTFHTSALIAIMIIPLYFIVDKSNRVGTFLLKVCIIISLPFLSYYIVNYFGINYGTVYQLSSSEGVSIVTIIRIVFILAIVFFNSSVSRGKAIYFSFGNNDGIRNIEHEYTQRSTPALYILCYIVGLLFTLGTFFYTYMDRVGQYFIIFELLVLPCFAKQKWCGQVVKLFVVVVFIFLRIMSFRSNGYSELPYIPFWMN